MCIFSVISFPVWSGGSLAIFPGPLNVGKIALNRENFLHTCFRCSQGIQAYWTGKWREGMSIHPYPCWYVQMSYICLSVHLYIC